MSVYVTFFLKHSCTHRLLRLSSKKPHSGANTVPFFCHFVIALSQQ